MKFSTFILFLIIISTKTHMYFWMNFTVRAVNNGYHFMDRLNHYPAPLSNNCVESSFPKFDFQYLDFDYNWINNKQADKHNINKQFLTESPWWDSW